MMKKQTFNVLVACWVMLGTNVFGDEHKHEHGAKKTVQRPRVFLDKSPRIVQYQLKRLDNERLLLVERKTDHPKYKPVYSAILTRAGMSPQYREESLKALVVLNKSNAAAELLDALGSFKSDDTQQQRTAKQLASILLRLPIAQLKQQSSALNEALDADRPVLRSAGYAGLIVAGDAESALKSSTQDEQSRLDWLSSLALIPKPNQRNSQRETVISLLEKTQPSSIRTAAIKTLASIPAQQDATFEQVAKYVSDAVYRNAAVETLLKVPNAERDAVTSAKLVEVLVKHAEDTPAAKRTTDEFIAAMQLADQLMARLPVVQARAYRKRLSEVTVRVVVIHTVEEEMRYDLTHFTVEAGRPVQIVLRNEDLMPHNLVITANGALKEVAQLGLQVGPNPGFQGKFYVPKSEKVLFATGMVPTHKSERLTFTAPTEPGEYPFVCTFPRHWMRMYGVMVVVDDLDAWLQNPTTPKDPIGSNRAFVKSWKVDDLKGELATGFRGRSALIGQKIFTEATCAQCHKVKGQGGAVGPDLTEVFKRWKGDRLAVLREVLEPSHRIDPKFAVRVIRTFDGKTVSGIVVEEGKDSISVLDNPEAKKPTVVLTDDIDEMLKTSKSMMPKALLDRFSKDEIFELLAYIESLSK